MKKKFGFTILELTVVIVLIAILAATAIPKLFGLTNDAHEAVARSIYGAIKSSLQGYHAEAILRSNSDDKQVATDILDSGTNYFFLHWNELFNPVGITSAAAAVGNVKTSIFDNTAPLDDCNYFITVLASLSYAEVSNVNGEWTTTIGDGVNNAAQKTCIWNYTPAVDASFQITYDPTKNSGENVEFLVL